MTKTYLISASYATELREFEDRMATALANKDMSDVYNEDGDREDKPYQVINGIALYGITGKMLASGNWFTEMLGIPTYDSIANHMSQMAQDESVEQVLINMDTPGGQVSGISDVSDTWKRLNAIKPVTVHTAGTLASAGVWAASNSSKIYASETAEVGSIGVILQHVSQEKALDKAGIKVTEIKSAPLKYVGSPAKDLTAEEVAHLQKKVDESFSLFKKQMYLTRPGVTEAAFTGEVFSAAEALQLGLIDGINTYSGVFEQLSATTAGSNNKTSYMEDYSMKKRYVTAVMASAAIEAGADPKSLEIVTDEKYAALPETEKVGAAPEEPELEPEVPEEMVALTAQVETLNVELATALMQNEELTGQVTTLTAQLEQAASDPLRVIAEDRVKIMRTALGMVSIDMGAFSTASLLAEYNALDANMKKQYKVGGHVKPKEGSEAPVVSAKVTSIETARLRATGI